MEKKALFVWLTPKTRTQFNKSAKTMNMNYSEYAEYVLSKNAGKRAKSKTNTRQTSTR